MFLSSIHLAMSVSMSESCRGGVRGCKDGGGGGGGG